MIPAQAASKAAPIALDLSEDAIREIGKKLHPIIESIRNDPEVQEALMLIGMTAYPIAKEWYDAFKTLLNVGEQIGKWF